MRKADSCAPTRCSPRIVCEGHPNVAGSQTDGEGSAGIRHNCIRRGGRGVRWQTSPPTPDRWPTPTDIPSVVSPAVDASNSSDQLRWCPLPTPTPATAGMLLLLLLMLLLCLLLLMSAVLLPFILLFHGLLVPIYRHFDHPRCHEKNCRG